MRDDGIRMRLHLPNTLRAMLASGALLAAVALAAPAQEATPTAGGDCCRAHMGPGCDDDPCRACVCALDGRCCTTRWSDFCVMTARDACANDCAACPAAVATPVPEVTPGGDCCGAHEGPGCDGAACQTCVCEIDPACCETAWESFCLVTAAEACAGPCACPTESPTVPPTPETPPTAPPPTPVLTPGGDCCDAHAGPSCDDEICRTCVCADVPECCTEAWTDVCLVRVVAECLDACPCSLTETSPTPGALPTATAAPTDTATATRTASVPPATPTATSTMTATATSTATATATASASRTASPSAAPTRTDAACVGDCDRNGLVAIDEIVRGVSIALGRISGAECTPLDADGDGQVGINELVQAVRAALQGCPPTPSG